MGQYAVNTTQISLQLKPTLVKRLDEYAAKQSTTRSELIRELLQDGIEGMARKERANNNSNDKQ